MVLEQASRRVRGTSNLGSRVGDKVCARVCVWTGMLMWYSIVNVLSWIAQFIGHGVFEKRAPALMVRVLLQ